MVVDVPWARIPSMLSLALLGASGLPTLIAALIEPTERKVLSAAVILLWLAIAAARARGLNRPRRLGVARALVLALLATSLTAMAISAPSTAATFSAVAASTCVLGIEFPLRIAIPGGMVVTAIITTIVLTLSPDEVTGYLGGYAANIAGFVAFGALARSSLVAKAQSDQLAAELVLANRRLKEHADAESRLARTLERERIAHELHDSLGHAVAALRVNLEVARHKLTPTHEAFSRVARAEELARTALSDLRSTVSAMRDDVGLESLEGALQQLVADLDGAGPAVKFEVRGRTKSLRPDVALALYRIAQEGLSNALRHAKSRNIRITLDLAQPDETRLIVADDGRGARPETVEQGLCSIRQRLSELGGELGIVTGVNRGLSLTAVVRR